MLGQKCEYKIIKVVIGRYTDNADITLYLQALNHV